MNNYIDRVSNENVIVFNDDLALYETEEYFNKFINNQIYQTKIN